LKPLKKSTEQLIKSRESFLLYSSIALRLYHIEHYATEALKRLKMTSVPTNMIAVVNGAVKLIQQQNEREAFNVLREALQALRHDTSTNRHKHKSSKDNNSGASRPHHHNTYPSTLTSSTYTSNTDTFAQGSHNTTIATAPTASAISLTCTSNSSATATISDTSTCTTAIRIGTQEVRGFPHTFTLQSVNVIDAFINLHTHCKTSTDTSTPIYGIALTVHAVTTPVTAGTTTTTTTEESDIIAASASATGQVSVYTSTSVPTPVSTSIYNAHTHVSTSTSASTTTTSTHVSDVPADILTSVLIYNMALIVHMQAFKTGHTTLFHKALSLYEMSLRAIDPRHMHPLMMDANHGTAHLTLALFNNMCSIHMYFHDRENALWCLQGMRNVLCSLDGTQSREYVHFFYRTLLVYPNAGSIMAMAPTA
jgi:hypothetical protein